MKSPIIYFIFYILVQQLTLATASINPNENPVASVTTLAPSTEDTTDVGVTSSAASTSAVDQGFSTQDGHNIKTTSQDADTTPEDGTRKATAETTPLNNGTENSTTSGSSSTKDKVSTTVPPGNNTTAPAVKSTEVITRTHPTAAPHRGAGYVIIILVLLVIIMFLVIIYMLHKKSKRYSFDLRKAGEDVDIPLNTRDPEGSFQPTSTKEDNSPSDQCVQEDNIPNTDPSSTPNGSASETGPTGDHDDGNVEKPPSEDSFGSQVPLSPKDEPGAFTLHLNDINLNPSNHTSLESLGEQQNTNNNNTAATRDAPGQDAAQVDLNKDFIEIHLDETV